LNKFFGGKLRVELSLRPAPGAGGTNGIEAARSLALIVVEC
jgi:hypothetical protein